MDWSSSKTTYVEVAAAVVVAAGDVAVAVAPEAVAEGVRVTPYS